MKLLQPSFASVLVACPDARPPAYQAVIGLNQARELRGFVTASYYDPAGPLASLCRRVAPEQFARLERLLLRRHDPEIPAAVVQTFPSFDLSLRLEAHSAKSSPLSIARWPRARTERFDRQLAHAIDRIRPELLLAFSDVGSMAALPLCRRLGIKTIVSMVHGDVREEQAVLERENASSPEFMPIYLGSSDLDRALLTWLHERRLRDLALADRVLVPSDHIAETLVRHGTTPSKIRVIPYAADCRRFHPPAEKHHGHGLHFPLRGGNQSSQGHQVPAGGLATNSSPRLAAPASRTTAGKPRSTRALSGSGRAARAGLSVRDAHSHGIGRRLRVSVTVRRIRRRHL